MQAAIEAKAQYTSQLESLQRKIEHGEGRANELRKTTTRVEDEKVALKKQVAAMKESIEHLRIKNGLLK